MAIYSEAGVAAGGVGGGSGACMPHISCLTGNAKKEASTIERTYL